MKDDTQEKIRQLQLAEQSMQALFAQKQSLQMQLVEIDTALKGLEDAKEAYRILGNVMILSDKASLQEDLKAKKETIELRIKSFGKQEKATRERAESIQKEVLEEMKNDDKTG
jgi:prefoldin beta subunit